MKSPDFYMPENLTNLNFLSPKPSNLELAWDLEAEEAEFEEVGQSMALLFYRLPDVDKLRVFLDAHRCPEMSRHRKSVFRDLAKVLNRLDKEIALLPDAEKARLFCRTCARLDRRTISVVMAGAITECYVPAAKEILAQLDVPAIQVWPIFEPVRGRMPDSLWQPVIGMIEKADGLTPRQRDAVALIRARVPGPEKRFTVPYSVSGLLEVTPLERHLLEVYAKDPAAAKPLITGLAQLNPERPENWLLFGLTAPVEKPPVTVMERAWYLTGLLFRWGDDLATVDQPFELERIQLNADAIRLIFNEPALLPAKKLVGEYLIRQLLQLRQYELAVEILPEELLREHSLFLLPYVLLEAHNLASAKEREKVQGLAARFPEVRAHGVLALMYRRLGEFEAARAELRNAKREPSGERLLIENRIPDAFELALPESRKEQHSFFERLRPFQDSFEEEHPEISYCQALYQIGLNDMTVALEAYDLLGELPQRLLCVRAYSFLAALQTTDLNLITDELADVREGDVEEILALLPLNLLKTAMKSLAAKAEPEAFDGVSRFFYQHLPELLDPILGFEELLAATPALVERFLDKNDQLPDSIQRWAGYQKVLQLSVPVPEDARFSDLRARAIGGCLSIDEPFLAPYKARMLQEQVTSCHDLELKEDLVERMTPLDPEQAKSYLYQLLHAYLGNNRPEDAWRMIDALAERNESSPDLDQCIKALQSRFGPALKSGAPSGKLPFPISVCFYGGDETDKLRTEPLRQELMAKHPGLTIEFEHRAWNVNSSSALIRSVEKFDVICASNLMRTDISRNIRQRARELGKTFGFCRNRGLGTISDTILKAVQRRLGQK